jgi:hypothetical protein
MFRTVTYLLLTLVLAACSSDKSPPEHIPAPEAATDTSPPIDEQAAVVARAQAPLLGGLGDFNHPITTADPWAQRYFNQGMIMASGFNHAEAIRAFKAAQRLDPECAMCFWGEALATGPNINVTSKGKAIMMPADRESAFAAIGKAQSLAAKASEREQGLIAAQARRYNGDVNSEREPLDVAYAQAMRELAAKYPDDDDIQALFAEALMNTMPWDYWLDAENPKPQTSEVIGALETVMARNPRHPLALHLYMIILPSAMPRVFIPRFTIRITFISCGPQRVWKGAARSQWQPGAKSRVMSGLSKSRNFRR